jgi:hypothetical protein
MNSRNFNSVLTIVALLPAICLAEAWQTNVSRAVDTPTIPALVGAANLKETLIMSDNSPRPSRPSPPKVAPILHKGISYEQDMQSYRYGGDQPGGYLVAINPATGERLWMLKVYEVPSQATSGVSLTPGRYFRSMRLIPERDEIEIENEVGGKYLVDLSKRSATWISGPDSMHK